MIVLTYIHTYLLVQVYPIAVRQNLFLTKMKTKTRVFYVPNICKNMKLDEKLLREIILGIHFANVLLSWLYQMSSSS